MAGGWRRPTHLVEVLLLLLDLGDVQQVAPHLTTELQRDSLVDSPHQLEGKNAELQKCRTSVGLKEALEVQLDRQLLRGTKM